MISNLRGWFLDRLRRLVGTQWVIESIADRSNHLAGRIESLSERLDALSAKMEIHSLEISEGVKQGYYSHQDTLILLERLGAFRLENDIRLETAHPLATSSDDYRCPRGAAQDNTRCPRFIKQCERIFGRKIRLLDLGCAGGGLVWDALLLGHFAIGLEGSDYPMKNQRFAWRILPKHLFNCDITKPFKLREGKNGVGARFDVVSAWELLEHIPEMDIPTLLGNVREHLEKGGLFIASVATFEDYDRKNNAVYHVTVKPRQWWEARLREQGFVIEENIFEPLDFARGSGNGRSDWSALRNPELGFHIVARNLS